MTSRHDSNPGNRSPGRDATARSFAASDAIPVPPPGRPILRFVCLFAAAVGAFYLFTATSLFAQRVSPAFLAANAAGAAAGLRALGFDSDAAGTYLTTNGFTIEIARGCDAVEPIVLFAAAVLAFPVPARTKAPGLFLGVACLLLANLLRIITLALTGLYWPAAFEAMHVDVWQALFILLALALWVLWARRVFPRTLPPPTDDHAIPAA